MYSIIKLLQSINYNSLIIITSTGDMMPVNCRACAYIYAYIYKNDIFCKAGPNVNHSSTVHY